MTKKKKGGQAGDMQSTEVPVTSDSRFTAMYSAPTFQRIPKDERKFKIDKRFEAVLTDDRFRAVDGGQVDKRGKKMKRRQRVVDDLQAFYTIDNKDDENGEGEEDKPQTGKQKGKGQTAQADPRFQLRPEDEDEDEEEDEEENSSSSEDEDEEEEEEEDDNKKGSSDKKKDEDGAGPSSRNEVEERLEYLNRLARGEVSDASTSSSDSEGDEEDDSSEEDEDGDDDDDDHDDGVIESRQLERGPIPLGEATRRLAIMNCDWEHLKAVDLLGVLLSFKPGQGVVTRVTVYYSDYGMEKMAEDAKLGPGFLRDGTVAKNEEDAASEASDNDKYNDDGSSGPSDSSDDDDDDSREDGEQEIDQEKLRAYEVQKLRYFFAVAECDSVGTASAIYEEVDGLEFENSSSQLDARFVPADVVFDGRKVRDKAETPLPPNYEPPKFVTKALQQTKVECTWDQGDEERERKLTQYHKWHEMDDDDLQAYLASSSSECEAEQETVKEAERKKLRSMLLGGIVDEDEEQDLGGDVVKEVTFVPGQSGKSKWEKNQAAAAEERAKEAETPFEQLLRKRKEKRKEKRLAKKLAAKGGGGDDDEEVVGEEDDFFAEAVTQKTKEKKKTKGKFPMPESDDDEDDPAAARRKEEELELLFAGEDREEQLRDFDMRALERKERLKDKKLKGKRKRKEEKRNEAAPGQDFHVDVADSRFAALFEGDSRFGIDPTSKEYKQTEGMQTILVEQTKRRRQKEKAPVPKRQPEQTHEAVRSSSSSGGVTTTKPQPGEKKTSSLSKLVQKFSSSGSSSAKK